MSPVIHYVVNARLPHTRAYGLQIAKMSEALIEAGAHLTLVVPNTPGVGTTLQSTNELRVDIPVVRLFAFNWYSKGKIAFLVSSFSFMVTSFLYLFREKRAGKLHVIYTVDMDTFSYFLLPLLGVPCIAEMHGAKRPTFANRFFFKRAALIIATNTEIKDAIMSTFHLPESKCMVEANGVDLNQFSNEISKAEARASLKLPEKQQIALYVGRFYRWKGLEMLEQASRELTETHIYVVGGNEAQFKTESGIGDIPTNLHIMGECKGSDVPLWLAAADVLLILGTQRYEQSYRFTAPMKVFEYMAALRPIVASATPALRSMASEQEVIFYTPDDARDLAHKITETLSSATTPAIVERALSAAKLHSWRQRAERILARVQNME